MSRGMTEKKLAAAIRAGLGQGRDEAYRSWIRVRRNTHSKVSRLQTLHVPTYEHEMHLLSGLEKYAAHVGLWLNAAEVREQFPFWPREHEHPATGLHPDLDKQYPRVRGLLEIAKEAGIEHGVYPGTNIPFVATMDFVWSIGPWEQRRLVCWGCKPAELLKDAASNTRILERIALERLWSEEVGAVHVTVDGEQWPERLGYNLNWLQPLRSEVVTLLQRRRIEDFGGHFMAVADGMSLEEAEAHAAARLQMTKGQKNDYFRAAAWYGYIDIDLTQPIVKSRPLRRDQSSFKAQLRNMLFGGLHERT